MPALNEALPNKLLVTPEILARITERRIKTPFDVITLAQSRPRRKALTAADGKLNIIAADHTARAITASAGQANAMCNRGELLSRIAQILAAGTADGVMATMDVLEELLLLADLLRAENNSDSGFMDNVVAIASLNRGGLAGSAWEMTDPITGASVSQAARMHLDGVKLLMRVCASDRGSLATIRDCAQAISAANAVDLPTFLEPLPVEERGGKFFVVKESDSLARIVGVATGLGDSSRYLWLKLPLCPDFDKVAAATTCPILALGGDEPLEQLSQTLGVALSTAHNVRGAMIGRSVLFPGDDDYLAAASKIHRLVHSPI